MGAHGGFHHTGSWPPQHCPRLHFYVRLWTPRSKSEALSMQSKFTQQYPKVKVGQRGPGGHTR